MKLIHCADLHLDSSMTTHLTKEKAKERKAELLASFNRMMEYADRKNVSAVLIAGDLFDRKKYFGNGTQCSLSCDFDTP